MTGLVFLHGWGYGPHAWQGWERAFPGRQVVLLDAGYFAGERLEIPANDDGWIGVGHSLGFAKLLGMDVPWRGLVGFGAFLHFCPTHNHAAGTAPELIDAMQERLPGHPAEVLRRFAKRCGHPAGPNAPAASPASQPDPAGLERLAADLRLLRALDLAAPQTPPPVLLLHAQDDRIAPVELAMQASNTLPGARLALFPNGGHALPFVKPDECLPVLKDFVDALQ